MIFSLPLALVNNVGLGNSHEGPKLLGEVSADVSIFGGLLSTCIRNLTLEYRGCTKWLKSTASQ